MMRIMKFLSVMCAVALMSAPAEVLAASAGHEASAPPLFSVIPFILMLLSIAIIPLKWEHWWEDNNNKLKVAMILGIPMGVYFAFADHVALLHVLEEYIAFIIYVAALFIISGGIVIRGSVKVTPMLNLLFLTIGGCIASFIGTPGASMLLIRPLLRINAGRKHIVHTVVFFIFIVSNIGGCLTPLGDPPLFLGYLQGVPFSWTFGLWKEWALTVALLLALYFVIETILYKKDTITEPTEKLPFSITGNINFAWIAGVVCCIAFLPTVLEGIGLEHYLFPIRELVLVGLIFMSLKTTSKALREENKFTYHPILEVAYLFIGIFLTMIPALVLLQTRGGELGVTSPLQFFWFTGILSSFLDNAPTYLSFFKLAQGMQMAGETVAATAVTPIILKAISLGAVFMGANTYIGNGPNFMVKAIADESGIKMPSFGGYMVWSFGILIPIFLLVTTLSFVLNLL